MTANQRRPGFRLPWSSDADDPASAADAGREPARPSDAGQPAAPTGHPATPAAQPATPAAQPATPAAQPDTSNGATPQPAQPPASSEPAPEPAALEPVAPEPAAPGPVSSEPPPAFMRELLAAMRKVADEARDAGVEQLKARADDAVTTLESDAEKRRQELRERAEADVAGVGEWARAEAERIKTEAEQRVASRRVQLEQHLAADETRTEAETKALRARVADFEREVEAFHAQLAEISDPAAFAAAVKRMPSPPALVAKPGAAVPPRAEATAPAAVSEEPTAPEPAAPEPADASGTPEVDEVHPAEEEVLAARLAELDAKLEVAPEPSAVAARPATDEPTTTDVVVKGLGSFGAITGFRQSLASQEGIDGVALSLGQTGEFVFRATHAAGVDVSAAIAALEGEGAKIEPRPEGGLRVTLERAR